MKVKLTALLVALTLIITVQNACAKERPNVIIILTDDQGNADAGYQRNPASVNTPAIDKLAEDGVVFTNGYASATVCAPTRAGLMTGRHQQRFGFYTASDSRIGLPLNEITIAEVLQKEGYTTKAVGKWHLGLTDAHNPKSRGFDSFYGFLGHGAHDYFDLTCKDDDFQERTCILRDYDPVSDAGYLTDIFTNEACDFIKEESEDEDPFFLYLAYNAVHWPLQAPEEDIKKFNTGDKDRDIYLAMLHRMDVGIGKVIDELKKQGEYDNTLIFFLSDNGGSKKVKAENLPLRDFKQSVYEGGLRVPFIVSWPNEFKPGVCDEPVISMDIFPTICSVIDADIPSDRIYDGKNVVPAIQGKLKKPLHKNLFFDGGDGKWAVRQGNWKALKAGGNKAVELYNLKNDLGEKKNLAAKNPEKRDELLTIYEQWKSKMAPRITKAKPISTDLTKADTKFSSSTVLAHNKVPNIIMILIDDQDLTEINAYDGNVYTPNMDQIAAEGIKFTNAYVSSTVCTPSRYTFLTGRYAGNSYSKKYLAEVGENGQGFPGFNVGMENDKMNIATVLKSAGYKTGFTGKFHVESELDQPEMFTKASGHSWTHKENGKKVKPSAEMTKLFVKKEKWGSDYLKYMGFDWADHIYNGNIEKPYNKHNPEWTMGAAMEFVEASKDETFFLQVCPTLLHGTERQWIESRNYPQYTGEGEIANVDPSLLKRRNELWNKLKEMGYDPTKGVVWGCAWIDMCVGDILDQLEQLGIDDHTLVIFAPDHGSSDKGSLYAENSTKIPLVMKWPNGIKAGIECDALVQNIDLAPTYFDLAGAKVPDEYKIDGISLTPLFDDGKAENWRDHLYFELGNSRAIQYGDWRYISIRYTKEDLERIKNATYSNLPKIMAPLQRAGIGLRGATHPGFWDEDQLYNIKEDKFEMNNLAENPAYAAQLKKMQELMTTQIKEMERPYGEFNLVGNAVAKGAVDEQIAIVKQIDVSGKKVSVPKGLKK